jgi:ABC-type enterochelin transport system permease subunit
MPYPKPPTPPNPRLLFINGVGQTIITSLTIIGSTYLLYALMKQGHGKLRVRLLLGMIFGDLLLGYVKLSCLAMLVLINPVSAHSCLMSGCCQEVDS